MKNITILMASKYINKNVICKWILQIFLQYLLYIMSKSKHNLDTLNKGLQNGKLVINIINKNRIGLFKKELPLTHKGPTYFIFLK